MTSTEPSPPTPSTVPPREVTGRVRVDGRASKLATRLEPGDIAVIDQPDLDRATAQALLAARPGAVLNAARSTTGRYPNLGPGRILAAGIPLIDDLGPDVMALREGDRVSISGGTVTRGGHVIAAGAELSVEDDQRAMEEARQGVRAQVQSFAASTGEYLDRESALLIEGEGLPPLRTKFEGRPVVIVVADTDAAQRVHELRRWMRDTDPLVIAVDSATELLISAHIKPDLIIGDMDAVPETALSSGAELVVRANYDGTAPGKARLDKLGKSYETLTATGTAEDAAILLADLAGASAIVTVGAHASIEDFLDRGRAGMASTFFTRLRAGDRVIPAEAVITTYRPRISGWWIVLLALSALVAVGAALWATPWGNDLWIAVIDHIRAFVDPATGSGSAG